MNSTDTLDFWVGQDDESRGVLFTRNGEMWSADAVVQTASFSLAFIHKGEESSTKLGALQNLNDAIASSAAALMGAS